MTFNGKNALKHLLLVMFVVVFAVLVERFGADSWWPMIAALGIFMMYSVEAPVFDVKEDK